MDARHRQTGRAPWLVERGLQRLELKHEVRTVLRTLLAFLAYLLGRTSMVKAAHRLAPSCVPHVYLPVAMRMVVRPGTTSPASAISKVRTQDTQ